MARLNRKLKKNKNQQLVKEIEELTEIFTNNPSEENSTKLDFAKLQFDIVQSSLTRGAQVRSRLLWREEGERNTKFFLRLETINATKKNINKLKINDGTYITRPSAVRANIVDFYEHLYKSNNSFSINLFNAFIDGIAMPKLSLVEMSQCEGPITQLECDTALNQLARNKSPGSDGLTTDFYNFFWKDILDLVMASFNESYSKGTLSCAQRKRIIYYVLCT